MKSFTVRLVVFALLVIFPTSAQALPLFYSSKLSIIVPTLTAQDIGIGKSEISVFCGTDNYALGYTPGGLPYSGRQDLNFRYLYGLADRVNVFVDYSFDAYPNFPKYGAELEDCIGADITAKVVSANTYRFGLKYSYLRSTDGYPMDIAFILGYQNTSATFNAQSVTLAAKKDWTDGFTGWSAGCIFSKKNQSLTPYLSLGYGQVNSFEYKIPFKGTIIPSFTNTLILLSLGVEYELPNSLSAVLEYQYENGWWGNATSSTSILSAGQAVKSICYLALKYKI